MSEIRVLRVPGSNEGKTTGVWGVITESLVSKLRRSPIIPKADATARATPEIPYNNMTIEFLFDRYHLNMRSANNNNRATFSE